MTCYHNLYYFCHITSETSCHHSLLHTRLTFSRSVIMSVCMSTLGRTNIHFVKPSVNVNSVYYTDVLLMQELLSDICQLLKSIARFNKIVHMRTELARQLSKETLDFISHTLWPTSISNLNPVDYTVRLKPGFHYPS